MTFPGVTEPDIKEVGSEFAILNKSIFETNKHNNYNFTTVPIVMSLSL